MTELYVRVTECNILNAEVCKLEIPNKHLFPVSLLERQIKRKEKTF